MNPSRRHAATLIEGLLVVCLGLAIITLVSEALRFFSTRSAKTTQRDAQAREGSLFMDRLRRTLKLAVEVTPTDDGLHVIHYARVDGVLRLVATRVEDQGSGRLLIVREDGTARREFDVGALGEALASNLGSDRVFAAVFETVHGEADRVRLTLRVAGGELELLSQASSLARGPGLVAHRAPRSPSDLEAELLRGVAPPPWPGLPVPQISPSEFEAPDVPDPATAVPGAEPTDGDLEEETTEVADPGASPGSSESSGEEDDAVDGEELPDPVDEAQAERQTGVAMGDLATALERAWEAAKKRRVARLRRNARREAVEYLDGYVGDPEADIAALEARRDELAQEIDAAIAAKGVSKEEVAAAQAAAEASGDPDDIDAFADAFDTYIDGTVAPLRVERLATIQKLKVLRKLRDGKDAAAIAAERLATAESKFSSAAAAGAAALDGALPHLDRATAQARAWEELATDATRAADIRQRVEELAAQVRSRDAEPALGTVKARDLAVPARSLATSLGG